MDKLMDNPNLWHLRDDIFGFLNHENLLNCRRVCKFWNESLARMSYVKLLQEFGDRDVENTNVKVSIFIPGWQQAVETYGVRASIKDLQEVNDSLKKLARGNNKCCSDPVHQTAKNGSLKLMEIFLNTSYNMNTQDNIGFKAWNWAEYYGHRTMVELIIASVPDSLENLCLAWFNPN